jgi:hypothetical protein
VTDFIRLRSPRALARRVPLSAALRAGLLAVVVLLAFAATASAVVTTVGSTTVGLQPRVVGEPGVVGPNPITNFANQEGNPVVSGRTDIYVVDWDPGDLFHHEWLTKLDEFFANMAEGSSAFGTTFSELGQYRDRANADASHEYAYEGTYGDYTAYPAPGCTDPKPASEGAITCLTDQQLREQLELFITERGTPRGMNTIYYVLTPPGVTVCLDAAATHCSDYKLSSGEETSGKRESTSYKDSFCSYHGDIDLDAAPEGDGQTVLYAAIPWTAGSTGHPGPGPLGGHTRYEEAEAYSSAYDCQEGVEPIEEPNQEGFDENGDYAAGLSDLLVDQIAEEQANIVTDPLLDGWHDSVDEDEVSDECRDQFFKTVEASVTGTNTALEGTDAGNVANMTVGRGRYFINDLWNAGSARCLGGVEVAPRFTGPEAAKSGETLTFDGDESTVSMQKGVDFGASGPPATTWATFTWNFGDGTEVSGYAPNSAPCETPWLNPCAGSVTHSYQYGGTYVVKLTVTDVAGNVKSVEHEVTVSGPAPPAPPPPAPSPSSSGSASSSATSSSTSTSSSSTPESSTPAVPTPVAAAAVVSRSLATVASKGLVVDYSVNEEVAGHFEVLLSSALARKLKIGGTPATGLPAGTPPQVVIAKALLVTTKGGHSTIVLRFSKTVAAKLRKAHHVSLTVRLVVRNSSSGTPATTTVLTPVTLG